MRGGVGRKKRRAVGVCEMHWSIVVKAVMCYRVL